jgi:hypothetical protein
MIKGIVITLLMMELLSETTVESNIPTMPHPTMPHPTMPHPSMPHNGQGQCLAEDMKVIEC